jgi:hypothetical protein
VGCVREDVSGPGGLSLHTTPTGGQTVQLCKVGPAGTWGDFSIVADGGVLPLGGSVRVNALDQVDIPNCPVVWYASDRDAVVTVTVTEVGATPGLTLDRISIFSQLDGNSNIEDPVDGSATAHVDFTHRAVFAFKNVGTPIFFEGPCNGLTPGYWKNWRNHYTAAEFTTLLAGTIAGSIAEADAIFAAKPQSSPVAKLKWFVLANQLTLNLTGTDLPNPDDAGLGIECEILTGDALGDNLLLALQMIANPGNFSAGQIEAVKNILDAIANMDETDSDL